MFLAFGFWHIQKSFDKALNKDTRYPGGNSKYVIRALTMSVCLSAVYRLARPAGRAGGVQYQPPVHQVFNFKLNTSAHFSLFSVFVMKTVFEHTIV